MTRTTPPLSIWLTSLLLTISLFFLLSSTGLRRLLITPTILDSSTNELPDFNELLDDTTCLAIFIGSSMTRYGISTSTSSKHTFKRPREKYPINFSIDRLETKGKGINLLKITVGEAVFNTWQDSNILNTIQSLQPDLLFIEDQAFFYYSMPEARDELLLSFFEKKALYFNNNLGLLKGKLIEKLLSVAPFTVFHKLIDHGKIVFREIRAFEESPILNDFLLDLSNNTQLIIFHTPRPQYIEDIFLDESKQEQVKHLLMTYQELLPIVYWEWETGLSTSYFKDKRHLNTKGSQVFSQWLFKRLEAEMESSCRH